MSRFTEDEVRQIYKMAETEDRFSHATDRNCNGTFYTINRMETKGVKLIVSPLGKINALEAWQVNDFINSPCVWVSKGNGTGRYAGLQGGWPTDKKERQEEMEFDNAVIRRDRNRYPNPDIDRPVEFMYLERDKRSYFIPTPGWMDRAKERIELYKSLRKNLPESLAAKLAREVTFNYHGKSEFNKLGFSYARKSFFLVLKIVLLYLAVVQILSWT